MNFNKDIQEVRRFEEIMCCIRFSELNCAKKKLFSWS